MRRVTVALVCVVGLFVAPVAGQVNADGDSRATHEPWVRFDAGRLGVSFEHPESMQGVGYPGLSCGGPFRFQPESPGRVTPRRLFFRVSGTSNTTPKPIGPGRQMQLAVWLGASGDGWGLAPPGDALARSPRAFGDFGDTDPIPVRLGERAGTTRDGFPIRRRAAPDGTTVVYRVDGDRGRVIHMRGAIRRGHEAKPIRGAERAAFDRLARSVAFFAPRSPHTEPCDDWTRWHGEAWSLCVPSEWVESEWPDGQDPAQRVEPIPPTRLTFEEPRQRFAMLTPPPWRGVHAPWDGRELVPMTVAGVGSRGPFPAVWEGERIVAGTWDHVKLWLREWTPTQGETATTRLLTNDAGQVGFLRIIDSPGQMDEGARVGPLGVPDKWLSMRYSLFTEGRVEHRVSMSAHYDHDEALVVFDRIARSFILKTDAVDPPPDLPVIR